MEVHHHSHPEHAGHRKKWTHYFWEFLMLFLAVFCGFLAEYQLEHKIEKDREKQFIKSYIEDLKMDTASMNRNLNYQKRRKEQLDSMMTFLETQTTRGNESTIYYLGRLLIRTQRFQTSDRTITQLKKNLRPWSFRTEDIKSTLLNSSKESKFFSLKK